jgi:uncharacterized protein (DUF2236 family)
MTIMRPRAAQRMRPRSAVAPEVDGHIDGVGALLAGTANVIMQLALAPVGYGVLESKVESGQVTKHPLKRLRTTFTYLAVTMLGNDDDRDRYRKAVNTAHVHVRSDENSPMKYNAFDPQLQLWVAACLYWGSVDLHARLHGPVEDGARADAFYEFGARFGTGLQVRPEMWPADRAAFDRYWAEAVARVSIDDPVREYLMLLVTRRYLPWPLRATGRFEQWVTAGFLPEPFREQMHLTWSARDEHRFATFLRTIGAVSGRMPGIVRRFPFNYFLWDMRRRVRRNQLLV